MSVRVALERDLEKYEARLEGIADSALAAIALTLADQLDDPDNSATSKSMCARELREHVETLEALLPPAALNDDVDDLRAKRETRRRDAARSAAAGESDS